MRDFQQRGSQEVIPIRNKSGKRICDARIDEDGHPFLAIRARNINETISPDELCLQIWTFWHRIKR